MQIIRAVLILALVAALSSCSWAQDMYMYSHERERGVLTDRSLLRDLKLGPYSDDLYNTDFLPEMHRLFQSGGNENTPRLNHILEKTLFALPLLKDDNSFELAVRPEQDLILTAGRRLAIRGNRKSARIAPPTGWVAIDTHVHTCASPDSLASPSATLISAYKRGLAGVAITDHDTISGAFRAVAAERRLKQEGKLPEEFFVIQGEEISSSDGHIIGLFLSTEVPSGKSAEWTVQAIHDQGGLAIAAHPMLPQGLHDLANTLPFDAVETESASEKLHYAITPGESQERRAAFYASVTKPRIGASDTHDTESIAECYTLVECASTPEAVREAITAGKTTPIASISDAEERRIVRRPLLRLVSTYRLLTDLSPYIREYTHSKSVSLSILPRPLFRYVREF